MIASNESLSTMGTWKMRKLKKGQRASRTFAKLARVYLAIPPITGWVGGRPEDNGFKRGGGK